MILYKSTIEDFIYHVDTGEISEKIIKGFKENRIPFSTNEEYSWNNSLMYMKNILDYNEIPSDAYVAVEYQLPLTSKRIDFLVMGQDDKNVKNVIIIELKQWDQAKRTNKDDLVITYLAKANRLVTHPSYQAYSYAETIKNYNESIINEDINLIPCCYLHNYKEEYKEELEDIRYKEIIKQAPVFYKKDARKLREFISSFVKKTDQGKILYHIENGTIKPSIALQDAISEVLKGNHVFKMIDEQKVAYSQILDIVKNSLNSNRKSTIIVEGGPGTGKSVIAINLLAALKDKLISYVTKNSAPKEVYFKILQNNNYKLSYLKNLFKGSGSFIGVENNLFDCLIVDEAHRLMEKSGIFKNKGENQILEIIQASKVSVFFIDEDQIVTTSDIGTIDEIIKQAKRAGSDVYYGDDLKLLSQFRCNGSDGYLAFLDNLLGIRKTANYSLDGLNYDFRVYDSPTKMKNDLYELNKINNKARIVAGYTYDWVTKNNPNTDAYDIELEDGFKAKWNFSNTRTWAIDEDSFNQVGCIHTCQGLEFDYVGVIIGKDLLYDDEAVFTDYQTHPTRDQSLKGIKKNKNYQLADKIIRNVYKVLMSRGQKGCFVYCEDVKLREYIKTRIDRYRG